MSRVSQTCFNICCLPGPHSTLFEDQVFSHDRWYLLRSAWRHCPEPIVCLRVAVGFSWELIYVVTLAVVVGLYERKFRKDAWPSLSDVNLVVPYSVVTFALSLLLVFRTNTSYSRWWEGRVVWGQIVNFARNLTRQGLSWGAEGDKALWSAELARWVIAAPYVLKTHLIPGGDLEKEVRLILTPQEVEWLATASNAPCRVSMMLSYIADQGCGSDSILRSTMDEQIQLYANMAGACERILKTSIPAAYTRHTSRFLMVYLTFAPFMLWSSCGWSTIPISALLAFLLIGVENIGIQIEEPFHVLPLTAFCKGIETNVREMQSVSLECAAVLCPNLPPIQHTIAAVAPRSTTTEQLLPSNAVADIV